MAFYVWDSQQQEQPIAGDRQPPLNVHHVPPSGQAQGEEQSMSFTQAGLFGSVLRCWRSNPEPSTR